MDTSIHDKRVDLARQVHTIANTSTDHAHDDDDLKSTVHLLMFGDCSGADHAKDAMVLPKAFGLDMVYLIDVMASVEPWRKGAILSIKNLQDMMSMVLANMDHYFNDAHLWSNYPTLMLLRRQCYEQCQFLVIQSKTLAFKMIIPCQQPRAVRLWALDLLELIFHINIQKLKLIMFQKFIQLSDENEVKRRRYRRSFGWIIQLKRIEWLSASDWQLCTVAMPLDDYTSLKLAIDHHAQWLLQEKFQLQCHWLTIDHRKLCITMRMTEDGISKFMNIHHHHQNK